MTSRDAAMAKMKKIDDGVLQGIVDAIDALNNSEPLNPGAHILIISGGQTGVDRAAIDTAWEAGFATGGWAPRGWMTVEGPDPTLEAMGLKEHPGGYRARTIANIEASDGTLVLFTNRNSPGTVLTINKAEDMNKPCFLVDLSGVDYRFPLFKEIMTWVKHYNMRTLNIAGNRNTKTNNIYALACAYLEELFKFL